MHCSANKTDKTVVGQLPPRILLEKEVCAVVRTQESTGIFIICFSSARDMVNMFSFPQEASRKKCLVQCTVRSFLGITTLN